MHFLHMAWLNFKGQRAAFNLEEFLLLETAYPFLTLMFHCVMAGYAFDTANLTDWVIGNAFLLCTNICVFSLGSSFRAERAYGRIRSIMVGRTSKIEIVLQKDKLFRAGVIRLSRVCLFPWRHPECGKDALGQLERKGLSSRV